MFIFPCRDKAPSHRKLLGNPWRKNGLCAGESQQEDAVRCTGLTCSVLFWWGPSFYKLYFRAKRLCAVYPQKSKWLVITCNTALVSASPHLGQVLSRFVVSYSYPYHANISYLTHLNTVISYVTFSPPQTQKMDIHLVMKLKPNLHMSILHVIISTSFFVTWKGYVMSNYLKLLCNRSPWKERQRGVIAWNTNAD